MQCQCLLYFIRPIHCLQNSDAKPSGEPDADKSGLVGPNSVLQQVHIFQLTQIMLSENPKDPRGFCLSLKPLSPGMQPMEWNEMA